MNEVAALRSDVAAALKDVRESDGLASPELAQLLSSISSSLEALRSQVQAFGIRILVVHVICRNLCNQTISANDTACHGARWRTPFWEVSALLSRAFYHQIFCSPSSWHLMSSRPPRPPSSKHWKVQEEHHRVQLCRQVIIMCVRARIAWHTIQLDFSALGSCCKFTAFF